MSSPTQILLIRHGETAWNAERRLQGHIDIALNAEGERQARALGLALQSEALDAIVSSDLQRALHTAQAIARHQPMSLMIDPLLRERCYGAFEGLTHADIAQRYPDEYARWMARDPDALMPPGERMAESFRQFSARVVAALLYWAAQYAGQKIAIVAHGGVLDCAYRAAASMPLSAPRNYAVLNTSINRFAVEDGVLKLVKWGDVAHLHGSSKDDADQAPVQAQFPA
ncbi:MAG: histidine phosphatase family protein [Pseudomonadota bacterium]